MCHCVVNPTYQETPSRQRMLTARPEPRGVWSKTGRGSELTIDSRGSEARPCWPKWIATATLQVSDSGHEGSSDRGQL